MNSLLSFFILLIFTTNVFGFDCFGTSPSSPAVCGGNGVCTAQDSCLCSAGYSGSECENYFCGGIIHNSPTVCSSQGVCVSPNTCMCNADYSGSQCENYFCNNIAHTSPSVCNSQGTCTSHNICSCNSGYTGDFCSLPVCFGITAGMPTVCTNNGVCTAPNVCSCNSGASGSECQTFSCSGILSTNPSSCSGNGVCTNPNVCNCINGWVGLNCATPICFSQSGSLACNGLQGTCTSPNNCTCESGYGGNQCEAPSCSGLIEPLACNGPQGICTSSNTCTCNTGWTGLSCEIPICFGTPSTDPNMCSGNGVCTSPDVCTCNSGWTGVQCQTPVCFGLSNTPACNNANGDCIAPDLCNCTTGWVGTQCQSPKCFGIAATSSTTCSGNGICASPDVCSCNPGWSGLNCETPMCFGLSDPLACTNGNGACVSPNICTCSPGWAGSECQTPLCYGISATSPTACSSQGSCTAPDSCSCNSGYTNSECQDYFCNSILFSTPTVCNAQGTCVAPDTCNCNPGWTGTFCTEPICFGFPANSLLACSGRGTCIAPNICVCVLSAGPDCSEFICNGILSSNPAVCSGNGTCVSTDSCDCNPGYTLPDCSGIYCQGILNNNPSVCSGHGSCIDVNICSCDAGWGGVDCSSAVCDGILSVDPSVCNGNGQCIAPNICVCDPGFSGIYCDGASPPPPTFCIVDNTFNTSHPDFGYIYFLSLTTALLGCRAQPIEHIKVSVQTITDSGISFSRNNVNQTELLIEPLTIGIPIIVGIDQTLTTSFNKITIRNIAFMSLDFPGGAVSSPGNNFGTILRGTTNALELTDLTLQSIPNPSGFPSPTNEPNVEYLIFVGVQGDVQISQTNLYGSRNNGIEISDLNVATPGTTTSITVSNIVGQSNWGNFIYISGVQSATVTFNTCVIFCGRILSGSRNSMIMVRYKPVVTGASTIVSNVIQNVVKLNAPSIQTGGLVSLSGYHLDGTGASTTLVGNINAFLLRNNVADSYSVGLRVSGISDDVLNLNYPPGHTPLIIDDKETLRELARLNAFILTTIGDFQGELYDVINSVASLDSSAAPNQICNDFCPPINLCCDVNSQFNSGTPGFGVVKFNTIADAIENRPGGCNISQTITRCVRLTRGVGIGPMDPWIHIEDVNFYNNEDILLKGEVNPVNNQRVRVIGNHVFSKGLNFKTTIQDIRFQPSSPSLPILSTSSSSMTNLPMMYNIGLDNLYFAPGNLTSDISTAGAVSLFNMSGNTISMVNCVCKPNLSNKNVPVIMFEFLDDLQSDCGNLIIKDNLIEQAKDNAISTVNVNQITMTQNTISECGSGATADETIEHFACVYIRACLKHPPLAAPIITGNTMSGASPLQFIDQKTNYINRDTSVITPNIEYTMLWLDTETIADAGQQTLYLDNIKMNEYSGQIIVRERINTVQFNFPMSNVQIERSAIRALNLANTGTSIFQETMFNLNDVDVRASPGTNMIFYCSGGCPEIDDYLLRMILVVSGVILAVIFGALIILLGAYFLFDENNDDFIKKDYKKERMISELKLKTN